MTEELNTSAMFELLVALVERANQDARGAVSGVKDKSERLAEQEHARRWLHELRTGDATRYTFLEAS